MASQLRFEGPVLEDLLERVRTEAGPDALIVAANKLRKGGVGGFFARETYEVLVRPAPEPDDLAVVAPKVTGPEPLPPRARVAAPRPRRPVPDILDLADAVSDAESVARPEPADAIIVVEDRADDVIDLGERTPVVSTETPGFAAVLERIARDTTEGRGEDPFAAPFVARRVTGADAYAAAVTDTPPGTSSDTPSRSRRIPRDSLGGSGERSEPRTTAAASAPPVPDATERTLHRHVDTLLARSECTPTALARRGLPTAFVPRNAGDDPRRALTASLVHLPVPPPPPRTTGVVIAVVGTGAETVLHARALAAHYDLDPNRVELATRVALGHGVPTWLQITDAITASERRASWRRRETPTVVAVTLPRGRSDLAWARELLDHLEPGLVWAVTPATWKIEDVREWTERLGGVDALALTDVFETTSPAAVLELGIPVGLLDDQPATPTVWADVLLPVS